MFKVQANSLDEYFDADPARKADLLAMDALIRKTVPSLERWFYAGAKAAGPGMKMSLIGYGRVLDLPHRLVIRAARLKAGQR